MVIAVLALLGVDLIVIVVLIGFILSRKRWVNHQPGAFRGAFRVTEGQVEGLGPTWRRGYGRWVRDVLVWTKAPFLFRNELVPVDAFDGQRVAAAGEVKRMGEQPLVLRFRAGRAIIEVAAHNEDAQLIRGRYRTDGRVPASDPGAAGS